MTILKNKSLANACEFKKICNFLQTGTTNNLTTGVTNDIRRFLEVTPTCFF